MLMRVMGGRYQPNGSVDDHQGNMRTARGYCSGETHGHVRQAEICERHWGGSLTRPIADTLLGMADS